MAGWIGVDLDGTLAFYDGWKGALHIGEPIPEMVNLVKGWLVLGMEIKVFTARVGPQGRAEATVEQIRETIQDWTEKHIGKRLEVTNQKDFGMTELWDDRAVRVIHNKGCRCCNRIS